MKNLSRNKRRAKQSIKNQNYSDLAFPHLRKYSRFNIFEEKSGKYLYCNYNWFHEITLTPEPIINNKGYSPVSVREFNAIKKELWEKHKIRKPAIKFLKIKPKN